MSFSATWGNGDYDVCAADASEDLVLEKAFLSPPLDAMAEDVRAVVENVARAAAELVVSLDAGKGYSYRVNTGGHVRQGDTDSGTVSISISEKVPAPVPEPTDATDEVTPGSSAAIADEQMGPL